MAYHRLDALGLRSLRDWLWSYLGRDALPNDALTHFRRIVNVVYADETEGPPPEGAQRLAGRIVLTAVLLAHSGQRTEDAVNLSALYARCQYDRAIDTGRAVIDELTDAAQHVAIWAEIEHVPGA